MIVPLIEFLEKPPYALGNDEGQKVFSKIQDVVSRNPAQKIFGISLKDIKGTDASFPRESVVSLAKMYKGEKGFFLCDFATQDLIDNWDYAAQAKGQPMIVKRDKGYNVIGPALTDSSRQLLDFIMEEGQTTTATVAERFDVSPQNASAKLKKLFDTGLILGSKEAAETGGLEFVFVAIK